jgi:beta-lysine 5,6-aminomutase beta subunit
MTRPATRSGRPAQPAEPTDGRRYVRAYGDATGDGMVQLSFTLPIPAGPAAEAAAAEFARQMKIQPAMVVHAKPIGPEFTFFVVYGRSGVVLDLDQVPVVERDYPLLAPKEINLKLRSILGRRAVVVGATVGTDAHTVGLDAILNVKGWAGEKGLESYGQIRVVNLGAQVAVDDLVDRAVAEPADALLVSQVVTQRDAHLDGVRAVAAAVRAACGERRPVLIAGGPRFDPGTAGELGVDRVFGRGTSPREVASYLAHALASRGR